jgi:hypothetical protein
MTKAEQPVNLHGDRTNCRERGEAALLIPPFLG